MRCTIQGWGKKLFSIYEAGNHLLICADYVEPIMHSHSAAHLMISLSDEIEVILENEKIRCRGIIIPSGMAHTANIGKNKVLIFLFDSTTNIAKQMNEILVLDDELLDGIVKAYHVFVDGDKATSDYRKVITNVYKCVNKGLLEHVVMDERIESALRYMRANLQKPLTCSDVAKQVFLSEGRFSHLFKEQVGMTFVAYLIYQRVMKTYVEIINGKSITEASIEAGFSSSTHFAEISKRLFGLSASAIRKELDFYKIAEI